MKKIAIDFGTTNTVVAVWREASNAPETIRLPGLSAPGEEGLPPLVPSLLYVTDGANGDVSVGHSVRAGGYDVQGDERFFASFKRGIAATNRPLARLIEDSSWDEARVGSVFLQRVLEAVLAQEGDEIDELVLSVPIQSFERYLKWLRDEAVAANRVGQRLRVVDESTAAALGYEVRTPGDLILVFDFGGGTLDVSLVRMPIAEEGSGVVLEMSKFGAGERLIGDGYVEARVIAKAGRVLGGDDIDHWLLDELLVRNEVSRKDVGDAYSQLKLAVEAAKIRLSAHESAEISVFDPDTYRTYRATLTRTQFEELLDRQEFFSAIQKTVDKVLRGARTRGIYPEDIGAVLMVGGTSLIPSVRRMVRTIFGSERVLEHKPFEAVAHGALGLAVGLGVDDFLYHSYGVRHLSPITGRHEWEEIIPAGIRYPLDEPVKLVLTASRDGQEALELVIGEVEESAGGITEVMFGDRAILMVEGGLELRRVVPLNEEDGARTVAFLDPPGKAGEDRVEVVFDVDQNRTLRVTVLDMMTKKEILRSVPVVELH
ncbi:MAG: Hsp70 family protein [Anaerolineae bacterium]|nr:Hsp70 family protein [Anaerolineae bacterium]